MAKGKEKIGIADHPCSLRTLRRLRFKAGGTVTNGPACAKTNKWQRGSGGGRRTIAGNIRDFAIATRSGCQSAR